MTIEVSCLVLITLNMIVLIIALFNFISIVCVKRIYQALLVVFYIFVVINCTMNIILITMNLLDPNLIKQEISQTQLYERLAFVLIIGLHLTQILSFYWLSASMQLVLDEITEHGF